MREGILIRSGIPHDSNDFARLIMLSSPTFLPAVFGTKASDILKSLFCHRHNLFSFQHCYFIKVSGRNAGMVLSYDWQTAKRERFKTGLLLLNHMKTQLLTQLSTLLRTETIMSKVRDGEYYISNLAVYPEYRNLGLGTRLLLKAEDEARKSGASKAVLDVEADNESAIRLYEKIGYTAVRKVEIKAGKETFKFLRMAKLIPSMSGSNAATRRRLVPH